MATTYMNMTLPTEDASDGVWDTLLNAALEVIDAHDHTSGSGTQVPAAGLSIDGDVAWGANNITGLKAARFTSQAGSLAAHTLGLVVKSNELYWVTSGGSEVQLTTGTTINTSILGGIEGDYSTTDASVYYDDATKDYYFWQDDQTSPETWARIVTSSHFIAPDGNGTNFIGIKAPAGLSADYNITFPAAAPGSNNSYMLMSTAGVITTDATPPVAETTRMLDLIGAKVSAGTIAGGGATITYWTSNAGSDTCTIDVDLPVGYRIKAFSMYVRENSANALTLRAYKQTMTSSWGMTQIGTDASSPGTGSMAIFKVTHTLGTPETIVDDTKYTLVCVAGAGSLDCTGFSITIDRT